MSCPQKLTTALVPTAEESRALVVISSHPTRGEGDYSRLGQNLYEKMALLQVHVPYASWSLNRTCKSLYHACKMYTIGLLLVSLSGEDAATMVLMNDIFHKFLLFQPKPIFFVENYTYSKGIS
jgi:hypothetical protein